MEKPRKLDNLFFDVKEVEAIQLKRSGEKSVEVVIYFKSGSRAVCYLTGHIDDVTEKIKALIIERKV